MLISVDSFPTVCRTCLIAKEEICSIFEANCGDLDLPAALEKYASIKISKEDKLPTKMCQKCIDRLCESHSFLEMCKKSEETLKISLEKKELESDDDECIPENVCFVTFENDSTDDKNKSKICKSSKIKSKKCKKCKFCLVTFETANLLTEHYKSKIHIKHTTCEICQKMFDDVNDLKEHMTNGKDHNSINIKTVLFCTPCDEIFNSTTDFNTHFQKLHESDTKCIQCGLDFKGSMKRHLSRTHCAEEDGLSNKICKICKKEFKSKYHKDEHMMIKHTSERFRCNICDQSFTYRHNLRRHMEIHTGKKHLCSNCGKGFSTSYTLKKHVDTMHTYSKDGNNKEAKRKPRTCYKIVCEVCGLDFNKNTSYADHMRSHEGYENLEYTCTLCKLVFDNKEALDEHFEVHKTHLCCTCGKRFTSKSSLEIHSVTHSENREFSCKICGKGFKQYSYLKYHKLVHDGEKPFKCKICSKEFRQPAHRRRHMYMHLNQRKYACDYCSKTYIEPSALKTHVRTHTGEKPFKCSVCCKQFHDLGIMKKHEKRHLAKAETSDIKIV